METLLIAAVILTALAIIAQAGVLVSMYLLSRRLENKAELLMEDSRRLTVPLEAVTGNLKTITHDLSETVSETQDLVLDTVVEARTVVMRPIRQYSAIALAVAEGFRTLFAGRQTDMNAETTVEMQKEHPAA